MNFDVKTIDNFKRELKRLLKKYPSLRKEVEELGFSLVDDPFQGTAMRDGFYKIRLGIKSKGKGKRGGVRPGRRFGDHLCQSHSRDGLSGGHLR